MTPCGMRQQHQGRQPVASAPPAAAHPSGGAANRTPGWLLVSRLMAVVLLVLVALVHLVGAGFAPRIECRRSSAAHANSASACSFASARTHVEPAVREEGCCVAAARRRQRTERDGGLRLRVASFRPQGLVALVARLN